MSRLKDTPMSSFSFDNESNLGLKIIYSFLSLRFFKLYDWYKRRNPTQLCFGLNFNLEQHAFMPSSFALERKDYCQ